MKMAKGQKPNTQPINVGDAVVLQNCYGSWSGKVTREQDDGWFTVRLATGGQVVAPQAHLTTFPKGSLFMAM